MARKKSESTSNGQKMALIYSRVSTKNQQEDGTSLDTQAEACIEHAKSLGYAIGSVTKEVYSGAELFDRPLLARDRELIRAGHYKAFVCYAIDRLSRDIAHLAIIADEFERAGCEMIFVTESLDHTPEGKLLQSVRAYVAEVERQKIRERTLRGKKARVLSGKLHNYATELYGYRRDKERGVREVYEPEAEVVRLIFQCFVEERIGTMRIARRLNAMGIPPRCAGKFNYKDDHARVWTGAQVLHVLRNPVYKGEAIVWTHSYDQKTKRTSVRPIEENIKLPDGVVQPIVSPTLWQTAQEIIDSGKGHTARNQKRQILLRGMVRCAECGRTNYTTNTGKKLYYCCSSRWKFLPVSCDAIATSASKLEEWVWKEVQKTLDNPQLIAREIERLRKQKPENLNSRAQNDIDSAKRLIAKIDKAQQRLIRRLMGASDDLSVLIERELAQTDRERVRLKAVIAEIEQKIEQQLVAERQDSLRLEALSVYCERVRNRLASADFDHKRLALEALKVRVIVSGRNWKLTYGFDDLQRKVQSEIPCQDIRNGIRSSIRRGPSMPSAARCSQG